jgi:tRNA modification GTPase
VSRDPIVAIATASGRGAIGIVRISGHGPRPAAPRLCGRVLEPRHATLVSFPRPARRADRPRSGDPLSGAALLHRRRRASSCRRTAGRSSCSCCSRAASKPPPKADGDTGEPRLARLRLARPGEFTERAFLNDKLDLAQAEAVADLIDASTEAAARSAARSLDGAFSREIGLLAEKIVELRLLVEATLDFPEEEIEFLERAGARRRLAEAKAQIAAVLATARQGALLNEGIRVVLAGQPNVGKSSLLNALAGAELAIVTDIPGTTRDKVGETIQIEGVPVHVTDTAGLREAATPSRRSASPAPGRRSARPTRWCGCAT